MFMQNSILGLGLAKFMSNLGKITNVWTDFLYVFLDTHK